MPSRTGQLGALKRRHPMDIIYLDQNHWIDLSRVHAGKVTKGPRADLYDELLAAVERGAALFPLSASHILETSKRNDQASRSNLAATQVKLSRGYVYRSRPGRLKAEVRTALRRLFGLTRPSQAEELAIVPGFLQAFPPFDSSIASPEALLLLERINRNFAPAGQYWDFMANQDDDRRRSTHLLLEAMAGTAISDIQRQRNLLKGSSVDLQRRAYATQLFLAHRPLYLELLSELERSFEELVSLGDEALRALVWEVPTLDIEAELSARIGAETRELDSHDLFDMQAMYTAIPYSQHVIAEKASVSRARQARLDKKYNATLSSSLDVLQGVYG